MAFCAKCGKEMPEGSTFCPSCGTPVGTAGAVSGAPTSGIDTLATDQRAQEHWIKRLIAIVIDYIVMGIVLSLLTFLVAFPTFFMGGFGFMSAIFGGIAVFWGLLYIAYFTLADSMTGASLGKHFLGLKVVSRRGSNPTIVEAFVRNLSKIHPLLLLLDVIVGLALSKGYQQKYSDSLVGTKVIQA